MDINTVNLILWAPFALVGLLAALVYCIKGAVKGWKAALVSLAAILLSALAGIFLARSLGGTVAPALQAMIPPEAFADLGTASGMVQTLVQSLVGTLAALVIFMGLFFLLTPILGLIGKLILNKTTQPAPVTGGSRGAGAAIGLVCALLYALVFLLPVYGSLAAYAPVVRGALDLLPAQEVTMEQGYTVQRLGTQARPVNKETAPDPQQQLLLRDILDAILQHPLVEISSAGPVRQAYNTLSQVRTEEVPVNLADMAATLETFMAKAAAVTQAPEEQQAAACRELVAFCRTDVLTQDWAYGVYTMVIRELPGLLPESQGDPVDKLVLQALEVLDLPEAHFRANAEAMLDFADAALDQKVLEVLQQPSYEGIRTCGLLPAAGKLLNATEQMVQLKNLFYQSFMEAAGEEKSAETLAFARKYPLGTLTDPAQQVQEAEAFCLLMGMAEGVDPIQFFKVHPSLGDAAFAELAAILGVK